MGSQEQSVVVDMDRYRAAAVVCTQVVAAQQDVEKSYEGQAHIRQMGVFGILRSLEDEKLPDDLRARMTELVIGAYAEGRVEGRLQEREEAVFQIPLAEISEEGES